MIIHDRPRPGPGWQRAPRGRWRRRIPSSLAFLGLAFTAVLLGGGTLVVSGADPKGHVVSWLLDHGYHEHLNDRIRSELLRLPLDWTRGLATSPRVARLDLDLSFADMQRLRAQHALALERGMLVQGEDDEVSGRIRVGSRSVRVRLRLKGDTPVHFERGRRSFRVHVKGDDALFGMRDFSLQHPITRDYHTEPLFLEAVRREGLLAPRYFFVDVFVNGDFEGRLALEEHFSRELLESQGRRESVILRFDEADYWRLREQGLEDVGENYHLSGIDAFQDSRIAASPVLTRQRLLGTRLLEGFRRGLLAPSDVFDAEATGALVALAEAWAADHALAWRNLRFYFDPVTTLLEPIAYDGKVLYGTRSAEQVVRDRHPFVHALLADSAIRSAHRRTLERVAAELDGPPGDSLAVRQEFLLSVLRRYYPLVRPLEIRSVAERARGILAAEDGSRDAFRDLEPDAILLAEFVDDPEGSYLEVASRIPEPLTVLDVAWRRVVDGQRLPMDDEATSPLPAVLPATAPGLSPRRVRIPYGRPAPDSAVELTVLARRQANGRKLAVIARPGAAPLETRPLPSGGVDELLREHPFLRLDDRGHLRVLPGRWTVSRPISVPRGTALHIGPGTTLAFAPAAWLLARGPLRFRGSPDAPISLLPSDPDQGWPGVLVLDAGAQSEWRHVQVESTIGLALPGWSLTSGVTFHESPVHIEGTTFAGNRTEDALNLIRSPFTMRDVGFVDAQSDALDLDFSDGRAERLSFEDIGWVGGGDALDLSGARVVVTGARFERIGDKAISVGERSHLRAFDVAVRDAGAGAVSKDGSVLELTRGSFSGARVALMTFRKKLEYGHPRLHATAVTFARVEELAVAETGSTLLVEERAVPTRAVDVERLYATVMRKGGGAP